MRSQAGMTLLEAIVALAVLGVGAMALFGWMGTNARSLDRVAAITDGLAIERSALAIVEQVNPMAEPDGERDVGDLRVAWTSRPITAPKPGRGPGGPVTVFDLALYEVDVVVRHPRHDVRRFSVRKVGWVTARAFEEPEP